MKGYLVEGVFYQPYLSLCPVFPGSLTLRVIYVIVLFLNRKDEVYRLWQNIIKKRIRKTTLFRELLSSF